MGASTTSSSVFGRVDRHLVCTGLGFALFMAWSFTLLCHGGLVSGKLADGTAVHDIFFPTATLAAGVTGIVLCMPPRGWQRLMGTRTMLAVILAFSLACFACTCLVGLKLPQGVAPYYALSVILGAGMAVLLVQWLVALSDLEHKSVAAILLLSAIVALLAFVIVRHLRKIILSAELTTLFSALLICASFLLFYAARDGLHEVEDDSRFSNASLYKIAVFSFVVSFGSQFLITYTVQNELSVLFMGAGGSSGALTPRSATENIGCLLCVLAIAVLLAVLWRTKRGSYYVVRLVYRIVVFSLVMSVGFAMVQLSPPFVAYTFALLSYFLGQTSVWLLALHASFLLDRGVVSFICYGLFSQFLGCFCGFFACDAMLGSGDLTATTTNVALLMLLALICCTFLFVLTDKDIDRVSRVGFDDVEQKAGPSISEKCRLAQVRYKLTDRETEILDLLARGHNAATIQQELFISYNTVKTHRYNLYAKLDLHSQQELLAFIEGLR